MGLGRSVARSEKVNIILGSGVVGVLARHILGPSWKIIPFHRSRFYSFDPALDDNFIIADPVIEPFVKELTKEIVPRTYPYRLAWSIGGQILPDYQSDICHDWLYKTFNGRPQGQAAPYLSTHMNLQVYGLRTNELYQRLIHTYMDEIQEEVKNGPITKITPHAIHRGDLITEYSQIISTIPLDVLCKLLGVTVELPSQTVHYVHLTTDNLNFEGFNQLLVVDKVFDFYKVTNIAPNRYLFYFNRDIPNPGIYLMSVMQKFDILEGTSITGALPLGNSPDLKNLEAIGITCLGSYAQWDWCMDVGSCIKRLLNMIGRNMKPKKPNVHKFDGL